MKLIATTIAACLAFAGGASAQQAYPTRNISLVVPFAAGAAVDIIARSMAENLTAALGQTVLVVNQPGAGGNIGAAAVARAQPDGYTILLATTGPAANNKFMYKDISFDSEKDFEAVAMVGTAPVIFAARPDAPFKTMKELVEFARANPDKLNAGFPGNGTLGHITGELIKQRQKVQFAVVQYQGTPAIIANLAGGHIDFAMDSAAPYIPNVQSGRLKALALGGATRFAGLPDVPTVAEAGFPELQASIFYALLAPRGTPAAIVDKLNGAANAFLKADATVKMFGNAGIQPNQSTPASAKKYIADEAAKWGPVIKGANITF